MPEYNWNSDSWCAVNIKTIQSGSFIRITTFRKLMFDHCSVLSNKYSWKMVCLLFVQRTTALSSCTGQNIAIVQSKIHFIEEFRYFQCHRHTLKVVMLEQETEVGREWEKLRSQPRLNVVERQRMRRERHTESYASFPFDAHSCSLAVSFFRSSCKRQYWFIKYALFNSHSACLIYVWMRARF